MSTRCKQLGMALLTIVSTMFIAHSANAESTLATIYKKYSGVDPPPLPTF
jgi:hypothetical protein